MRIRFSFTLIELIIVMAVIALLAGLLLGVFSKARDRARMTGCASALKQIGTAINSYTVDYGDHLPVCERLNSVFGLPTLKEALKPYLSDLSIFGCPGDRAGHSPIYDSVGTSYEWNTFVNGLKIDRADFTIGDFNVVCPILGDANASHCARRNYLYSDGRTLEAMEVLISK